MEGTTLQPMANTPKSDKDKPIGSFVACNGKRFYYTAKNKERVRLRFIAYARSLYYL